MKLKKCPHCGADDIRAELSFDKHELVIFCGSCPSEMHFPFAEYGLWDGSLMSVDEVEGFILYAAKAWNRRAR